MEDQLPKNNPTNLYDPASYIMQLGGKRIRPVLSLLAADAVSNSFESALPVALAVEVFHNFSLVHDDIMDEAPLRRGCLLYTSPSPRDLSTSRMPSSA